MAVEHEAMLYLKKLWDLQVKLVMARVIRLQNASVSA